MRLAQERAVKEAINISRVSEEAGRKQWEIKRIQAMALAQAKVRADEAKKLAEKTNNKTFVNLEELTIMVNGSSMTFKNLEEKRAWENKQNATRIDACIKNETYVKNEEAWTA
jgi:hypothetical protein